MQPEVPAVAAGPALKMDDPPPPIAAAVPPATPPPDSTRSAPPADTDKRGPANRNATYRRALAGRTPEVQACAKVGAGGLAELTVAVDIETSGRVSARLVGAPEGPLSRCVDAALRHTPVAAPPAPIALTHTFPLRTTPHP
ncbi:MAG: hypothetical protein JNK56_00690 [Myxococcales bacterium]|nr:hypothetical protein [Myxococcales bacterium]